MAAKKAVSHIRDLREDPLNANEHTARNIGLIADALQHVGAARSIVIDEDGVVLAGNGVVEAAAQVGIERVKVVEADGNEIVAVRRRGLTEEQKIKLALYDNRASDFSRWNPDVLRAIAEKGVDLLPLFTAEELAGVAAAHVAAHGGEPPTAPEAFPAVDESLPTEHRCPKCGYEWSGDPRPAAD